MGSLSSTLGEQVQRDLWQLTNVDGVNKRLPATMTITIPGASRDQLSDLALNLRHNGFGTESFPMFYNGLKESVQDAQAAFAEGKFEKKHLDVIERRTWFVANVMQRASTTIKDWMTMLFSSIASREKDNN